MDCGVGRKFMDFKGSGRRRIGRIGIIIQDNRITILFHNVSAGTLHI